MNQPINELTRLFLNTINIGVVSEVAPPEAKVEIKGVETGLLPILCHAGSTKTFVMPKVGEQVVVVSPNGNLEDGLIIGSIYSETYPAPTNEAKEVMIDFEDGSFIKKTIEGKLEINQVGDLDITAENITINGSDIKINGSKTITIDGADGVSVTGSTINLN